MPSKNRLVYRYTNHVDKSYQVSDVKSFND